MPPATLAPLSKLLSGRYLSFAEREEIALWRAQNRGVREIARHLGRAASTILRELRRNAATRSGGLDLSGHHRAMACPAGSAASKAGETGDQCALRIYVQERLSGAVVAPGGVTVPGSAVPWKGRRHGRRQERR